MQETKPGMREYMNQHYAPQGGFDKFEQLFKAGMTQRMMASHFKCTEKTIHRYIKKYRGLNDLQA